MDKRMVIDGILQELGGSLTTQRTDLGFNFILNRVLSLLSFLRAQVVEIDPLMDYIYSVLCFQSGIKSLESLLCNEIRHNKRYLKFKEYFDASLRALPSFESYALARGMRESAVHYSMMGDYSFEGSSMKRSWKSHCASLTLHLLDQQLSALVTLMDENNLLLKRTQEDTLEDAE